MGCRKTTSPTLGDAFIFYKGRESVKIIRISVENAISIMATPYDVEVELVTAKGDLIWTRAIGKGEFVRRKNVVGLMGNFFQENVK